MAEIGGAFCLGVGSLALARKSVKAEINQVLNHKHLGNGSILLSHNDAKYIP